MHRFSALASLVLVFSSACSLPASDPAPIIRGPLRSRPQHPFAQTLLHNRPRRAVIQPMGDPAIELGLTYSSIHEIKGVPGELIYMDGETARATFRYRRGLSERTDLEVELADEDFLDDLIEGFHDWTGLPNQGRDDFGQDQFGMRLRRNGDLLFSVEEDKLQLGDLPLTITHALRVEDEHGPAVAVRAAVEIPSGNEAGGSSNGGLDIGFGVLAERTRGRWSFFGAVDYLAPHDPDAFRAAGVGLEDILSLQLGIEYRWSDRLSVLFQNFWTSEMTKDFTFEEFSREMYDIAVGVAWDGPGDSRFHFALQEDAVAATGSDFGIMLGVAWGF